MPHLIVRGIEAEKLRSISKPLVDELAEICKCGTDNFMVECLQTTSVFDGEFVSSYPFVDVSWFERGQETRDAFAQTLTKHILSLGIPEVEVAFRTYRPDSYYVNGDRPFDKSAE